VAGAEADAGLPIREVSGRRGSRLSPADLSATLALDYAQGARYLRHDEVAASGEEVVETMEVAQPGYV